MPHTVPQATFQKEGFERAKLVMTTTKVKYIFGVFDDPIVRHSSSSIILPGPSSLMSLSAHVLFEGILPYNECYPITLALV